MGKLGERFAGPERLIGALKDSDASVRANAVETIGKIGPEAKSAIPEMLPLLKDADAGVRLNAVFAYRGSGRTPQSLFPISSWSLKRTRPTMSAAKSPRRSCTSAPARPSCFPRVLKQMRDEKSAEVRPADSLTLLGKWATSRAS